LGAWFTQALASLELSQVRAIRAQGLMIGIELRGRVTPVLQRLQEEFGILALPAGLNVLRLLPPLVISQEELQRIVDSFQEVLA
jgi:acetylornithine/LysW-gamma-L-lysine aminotransferase